MRRAIHECNWMTAFLPRMAGLILVTTIAPLGTAAAQSLSPPPLPCDASGYRVLARHWDAVLKVGWELRQDCLHPEWPARSFPLRQPFVSNAAASQGAAPTPAGFADPVAIHVGDTVRIWGQSATVRIEMQGIAEQSARRGETLTVRIAPPSSDSLVQHLAGIVRDPGEVEMAR